MPHRDDRSGIARDDTPKLVDWRYVDRERLGMRVHEGGEIVTIHQRDHLFDDEWQRMIISADDLRALVRLLDEKR